MNAPRRVSEATSRATLAAEALDDFGFDVRSAVPEAEAILAELARLSETARGTLDHALGVAYADGPDAWLDIYRPAGPGPHPVLAAFHGGVPGALGAREGAFMAQAMASAGIMTVSVQCGRASRTPLAGRVAQCRRAALWIGAEIGRHGGDAGRVALYGHGWGGHLAAMACAEDGVASPPRALLLLSGVFDLAPLSGSALEPDLDRVARDALSPVHRPPPAATRVVLSCGEYESEALKRQTDGFFRVCAEAGCRTRYVSAPRRNHFDIALGLADPDHAFVRSVATALAL